MSIECFSEIVDSLEGWPNDIGIMGGEPLLHPQFKEIVAVAAKRIPRAHLRLWTSGLPGTALVNPTLVPEIADTFGHIHYNPHDAVQIGMCRHQPLTIAVDEAVPDKGMMWKLINNCWLPRQWAPSVVSAGAYFCEVAGPLDAMLYGGRHAWKIEPGWWKRPPEAFQEQIEKLCTRCGMCLPMERQLLEESVEKFSPKLAEDFRAAGAIRMDDEAIEIFDGTFSNSEIQQAAHEWFPGNYREDLRQDAEVSECAKGFVCELTADSAAVEIYQLDSDRDFERALATVSPLSLGEQPKEFAFFYKGQAFHPLKEPYPFVLEGRQQENRLYFRAMLLHFRQLLDDDSFATLKNSAISHELLCGLAHKYRVEERQYYEAYIRNLGERLAGKKVYFWGHGAAWLHYAADFAKALPQCFLEDTPCACSCPTDVSGVPVRSPEELLAQGVEPLSSVMFVREISADWAKNVAKAYGKLIDGPLHVCLLRTLIE